jgi:hypothetical protein
MVPLWLAQATLLSHIVTSFTNNRPEVERSLVTRSILNVVLKKLELSLGVGEQTNERDNLILVPLRASNKPSKQWRQNARKRQASDNTQGHPRVWLIGDAV